jgi:hypothetical protein
MVCSMEKRLEARRSGWSFGRCEDTGVPRLPGPVLSRTHYFKRGPQNWFTHRATVILTGSLIEHLSGTVVDEITATTLSPVSVNEALPRVGFLSPPSPWDRKSTSMLPSQIKDMATHTPRDNVCERETTAYSPMCLTRLALPLGLPFFRCPA